MSRVAKTSVINGGVRILTGIAQLEYWCSLWPGGLDTVMIKPLADKMADQTQKKGERMGIDQHPFGTLNNKVPRDPHKIPYLLLRNTFRSYNNL